jgi:hypothetical protein
MITDLGRVTIGSDSALSGPVTNATRVRACGPQGRVGGGGRLGRVGFSPIGQEK